MARGERALLVVLDRVGEAGLRSVESRTAEARGLAAAIGIDVVASRAYRLRQVRPASLLGKGQIEEMTEVAADKDATLIIVDAALTPVQQKTIEGLTKCKVIDRTGLILEIFG